MKYNNRWNDDVEYDIIHLRQTNIYIDVWMVALVDRWMVLSLIYPLKGLQWMDSSDK